jgi:hypothetical protein
MSERQAHNTKGRKKPYVKPELKQVQLRPEEAVLAACKTAVSAGALQAQCTTPLTCVTIAS